MTIATLLDALDNAEQHTDRGFVFLDGQLEPHDYSFRQLSAATKRRGRQLQQMGFGKGDRIGLIIPDNEDFVLTFLGAISVGVVPVPMYPPLALGKLDAFLLSATRILGASGAKAVVTTKKISAILGTLLIKVDSLEKMILVDKFKSVAEADRAPPEISPDDTCFLQFTSGSTSDPKGVVVTHANLIANANAIMQDGLRADPTVDRGISWLPLYHDMGLIGFVIAPLCTTTPVVFIPTLTFVKRPTVWMKTVNDYRGTITFAPNFAFALAAKRARAQKDLDLSCLRVLGCGAEPINARTIRKFVDAFSPMGLNENAVMPCYGMAEATLAMAFEPLTEPLFVERIDRDAYENTHEAMPVLEGGDAIELVACGRSFPNHAVGIMDPGGELLPDGKVGEIVFRGPSVTRGYFDNPQATAETIVQGWLHTGDLGFMRDGRVFVSGRKKDLIILNGRNYHPQAIEWEVEKLAGIRKGNIVAFAISGESTEKLVVVAETKAGDHGPLVDTIKNDVRAALGLVINDVVLVPAGALPKTSSGKLQRRKTRAAYIDGSLGSDGIRTMGKGATRRVIARHVTSSFFAKVRHNVRRIRSSLPAPSPVRAVPRDNTR